MLLFIDLTLLRGPPSADDVNICATKLFFACLEFYDETKMTTNNVKTVLTNSL